MRTSQQSPQSGLLSSACPPTPSLLRATTRTDMTPGARDDAHMESWTLENDLTSARTRQCGIAYMTLTRRARPRSEQLSGVVAVPHASIVTTVPGGTEVTELTLVTRLGYGGYQGYSARSSPPVNYLCDSPGLQPPCPSGAGPRFAAKTLPLQAELLILWAPWFHSNFRSGRSGHHGAHRRTRCACGLKRTDAPRHGRKRAQRPGCQSWEY
jgi:hypothetical protein